MHGDVLMALVVSALLASSAARAAPDGAERIWGLNVLGGSEAEDTMENFYSVGRNIHDSLNQLGVPRARTFEYFGQSAKQKCFSRTDPAELARQGALMEALDKDPKNCALAKPIYEAIYKQPGKHLVCARPPAKEVRPLDRFNGSPGSDFRGAATKANLIHALDRMLDDDTGAKVGDHVFINLNDHGLREDGRPEWDVFLSSSFDTITTSELEKYVDRLSRRGVHVHLNVQACYSGGFQNLTRLPLIGGDVCVTSDSDDATESEGSDEGEPETFDRRYSRAIGGFHNQLQAFACALAGDSYNRSMTSLDHLVGKWEGRQIRLPDCPPVRSLDEIRSAVETGISIVEKARAGAVRDLRASLLSAFKRQVVDTFYTCVRNRDDEVRQLRELNACLDDKASGIIQSSLRDSFKEMFAGPMSAEYDERLVARHLRFLKEADEYALRDYRKAYCCLAYDLKNRQWPELCQ